MDVIGGTAIITNNGVIKSTATSDGSGIVIVGAGSATITNGPTGVIQGTAHAGIMVSTTAPTTTITNYGNIISGGVLSGGIKISSANTATVDQYGVITATATGSAGIWLTAASARVNLNIREGSSFAGLGLKMDDPAYTGSTIRFYAANYSLSVQNFLLANHTVTAMSPAPTSISSGPTRRTATAISSCTRRPPRPRRLCRRQLRQRPPRCSRLFR